jgi:hypothetical protein
VAKLSLATSVNQFHEPQFIRSLLQFAAFFVASLCLFQE